MTSRLQCMHIQTKGSSIVSGFLKERGTPMVQSQSLRQEFMQGQPNKQRKPNLVKFCSHPSVYNSPSYFVYQRLRSFDPIIEHFDVITACLNANVQEDIFMQQTHGFQQLAAYGTKLICKLQRSLNDIKQAPRSWQQLLSSWLIDYGFQQCMVKLIHVRTL